MRCNVAADTEASAKLAPWQENKTHTTAAPLYMLILLINTIIDTPPVRCTQPQCGQLSGPQGQSGQKKGSDAQVSRPQTPSWFAPCVIEGTNALRQLGTSLLAPLAHAASPTTRGGNHAAQPLLL